jgi:hypothetical protein
VKSLVNQNRNFEPIGKLTLNVQNLESLYPEGKEILLACIPNRSITNKVGKTIVNKYFSPLCCQWPTFYPPTAEVVWGKTEYLHQHKAFQTHQLCGSYWVFSWWQMKGTRVLFIHFPDMLAINYTTLRYCSLPRSGLRKNRISTHRQWHCRHTNYVATLE